MRETADETCGGDMINVLPEDLLIQILILIPIKDAVATMILSKRWRFVWTMLPTLNYKENNDDDDGSSCEDHNDYDDDHNDDDDDHNDDDDDHNDDDDDDDDDDSDDNDSDDDDDKSQKRFFWFLEKSLQFHKAPVIDSLTMKLGPRFPTDANVGKWVAKAVDRRVSELKIKLLWSADPTRLPKSLYTCKTLVKLTLSHNILVDFPSSSCLQSLEILKLYFVKYKDEDSVFRVLSSCPVLKILFVMRMKDDNVKKFIVKAPSLYALFYSKLKFTDNDVGDIGRCLVIDTPKLIYLAVIHSSGDYCFVDNMPCLETAALSFRSNTRLLRYLSSVLSLELSLYDQMLECCRAIKFSRLIKLTISPEELDWLKSLMLLLGNAPKLKHLVIDNRYTAYEYEDETFSWNQPSYIPKCLSSQLDTFEWREYGDSDEETEFLTYILANCKCLKTATISVRPTFDLQYKDLIISVLKDIPRVSTTSRLLFK